MSEEGTPEVIEEPGDTELPYGHKPGEVIGPDGQPIVTEEPAVVGEEPAAEGEAPPAQ